MHKPLNNQQKAVGYIRVSTNLQLERDNSIERQAARIREACSAHGWGVLRIYEDVASAVGKGTASQRHGLRDALDEAKREGAVVVVTEPTRLFRNKSEGLKTIQDSGIEVFSVKDDRFLTCKDLGIAFKAGEEFAEDLREGASRAATGRNMPTKHLPRAAAKSARARAIKSEEVAEAIADAFERDPSLSALTHKALAEELNRLGIRSGWGLPWNAASVRDRRKRASEILQIRKVLEAENDAFSPEASPPVLFSRPDMNNAAKTSASNAPSADVEPDESETDRLNHYRNLPTFGMF